MNKKRNLLITAGVTLLLLIALFWNPIIDFLPIDQSGWRLTKGQYYYLDEDGDRLKGWQDLNGKHYYFDPADGIMQTGWLETAEGIYNLRSDGNMRTGWYDRNDRPCYLQPDGKLATGWLEVDGQHYYMNSKGNPVTGLFTADGRRCYADEEGILQTGWVEISEDHYYFQDNFSAETGWAELDDGVYFFNPSGIMQTGWLDMDGSRYYLGEDGRRCSGWAEVEDARYYFDEDGILYTGWLELEGKSYYLTEDGSAATGRYVIEDQTYFFSSTGENFLMVNRWNRIPEGYTTELQYTPYGYQVSVECYDSLMTMLQDCRNAGCYPYLIDGYRSNATQHAIFQRYFAIYLAESNDYGTAYYLTKRRVADPGTSEHELGLAIDIKDGYYGSSYLNEHATLYWLSQHCWEYGWILRYPSGKSNITGIMYEPWHFRYVGVELAMELKDSGLCLEEYLDALTADGTTCGNPNA